MDEAVWRGLYPVWCGGMRNLVCRQVPAADSGAGTAKTDGVSFKGADSVRQRTASGSAGNSGKADGRSTWDSVSGNGSQSGVAARRAISRDMEEGGFRNGREDSPFKVGQADSGDAGRTSWFSGPGDSGEDFAFVPGAGGHGTGGIKRTPAGTLQTVYKPWGDGRSVSCGDPGLMEGTYGSESDFPHCCGGDSGVCDLPGAAPQWTGRAGIFDQSGGPCACAVLAGAVYL